MLLLARLITFRRRWFSRCSSCRRGGSSSRAATASAWLTRSRFVFFFCSRTLFFRSRTMSDQQISSLLEQQRINQQLQTELINLEQSIYATLYPKFLQARLSQLRDKQKLLESEIKS